MHHVLGERAAELLPLLEWDEGNGPVRTAAEIVEGLEVTWRIIGERLIRGAAGDAVSEEEAAILQRIWGMLDHDLPHAGELSLLLGADGLARVEI